MASATRSEAILVATLGTSWAVLPEIVGAVRPDIVDLYARHPRREAIRAAFAAAPRPGELWVVTTVGAASALGPLRGWAAALDGKLSLRLWVAEQTDALSSADECARMRELIHRVVLRAAASGRRVSVSLAGGRKTMSADLQSAAHAFGCEAMCHVVGQEPVPPELRNPSDPGIFLAALDAPLASALEPLMLTGCPPSELFDTGASKPDAARFPVPEAPPFATGEPARVDGAGLAYAGGLVEHLNALSRDAARLRSNHVEWVLGRTAPEDDLRWRTALKLPSRTVQRLRTERVGVEHRALLRGLPRSELHFHLGGCLTLAAQRRVAEAVWEELARTERAEAESEIRELVGMSRGGGPWPAEWPGLLRGHGGRARTARVAALFRALEDSALEGQLYPPETVRLELAPPDGRGDFREYEKPGELSGSGLLQTEAGIAAYAREVWREIREQGLFHVELRGSPRKYLRGDAARFMDLFTAALAKAKAAEPFDCSLGFIWITDRRELAASDRREELRASVEEAVSLAELTRVDGHRFVLGLDVAGDEQVGAWDELRRVMEPAYAACLPVTIHAGEGLPSKHIWDAVYGLHADRIGHGLSLADAPELADKVRRRGICLEVCMTSNREVVGFRDPEVSASRSLGWHPLPRLLELGLPVALSTDNSAISRTNSIEELITAGRMTETGLSLASVLGMLRNGLEYSFLSPAERAERLYLAEKRVFDVLTEWDPA